jgi:DNA-binding NarL/FixJ family response regulator
MKNMVITLLLYEDNDMLRESIGAMLQLDDRFRVLGSYNNAMDADLQVREHRPDIVLMDIDMPGRTGIETLKRLRTLGSQVPVIMLTVFDDTQHVFDALCAGAAGYLLKKHISVKLIDAIDEVLNGGAPMSPSIAHMVIAALQKPASNPYELTNREKEILSSLSFGNSYKMIAAQYDISVDTVRAHIKRIYFKLQVHSQTEAVSKAMREKLV